MSDAGPNAPSLSEVTPVASAAPAASVARDLEVLEACLVRASATLIVGAVWLVAYFGRHLGLP